MAESARTDGTAQVFPAGTQAIVRALAVLDVFSPEEPHLSTKEISSRTSLPLPTVHRIVKLLEIKGLLSRSPGLRKYSLGSGILRYARVVLNRDDIAEVAMPSILRLRGAFNETVSLHMRLGNSRVCILEQVSRQPIRITSGVGTLYALNAGAASKAILSALPVEEVTAILDAEPEGQSASPMSRADFSSAVDAARDSGHALSEGETVPGARAMAVAVRGKDPLLPLALNITAPAGRMPDDIIARAVEAMHAEAEQLNDWMHFK